MKKKTVIILTIAFAILVCVMYGITEDYDNRTDEEYVAVLLDNREDFEYIAQIMQQWEVGAIRIRSGGWGDNQEYVVDNKFYVHKNQEIANEIENNQEFYDHLENIYDLGEISVISIVCDGKLIEFAFGKKPHDYSIRLYYVDNTEGLSEEQYPGYLGPIPCTIVDEHWVLNVFPNT